jgi:HlyD family secretion protein
MIFRKFNRTNSMNYFPLKTRAALFALLAFSAACKKKEEPIVINTAPVERRDITVSAQANGTVEPINIVEVKSKASGQIVRMPVDVGSMVKPGDLLVQIDTRDVQNQYNQALADLRSAQIQSQVALTQRNRARALFAEKIITAQENESAIITYSNAEASIVRARTNLDLAKQRLEDATVRAPVAGTVIEKPVSLGQVITSATSGASGGTTILKMADLTQVRMRAFVNETDIGNVRPGQVATVTVDAYPDRRFTGTVEKVEPQAVVQQSVTMFPVLVSLSNPDGSLKPGMNGEVLMIVEQRLGVLAIPSDAVRSMREIATVAPTLGLDPDSVQAQMRAARANRFGNREGAGGASSSTQGASAASPNAGGMSDSARAARRAQRMQAGGDTTRRFRQGGDTTRRGQRGQFGGGQAGGGAPGGGQFGGGQFGGGRTGGTLNVVFTRKDGKFTAKPVRTGVSDFDYTEVVSGLVQGEQVALLGAAALQAQRQQRNEQLRSRAGGVPGMQQTPPAGSARPGGTGGPGGGGGNPNR